MAKVRHYIDGQNRGEPRNWQELEIVYDFLGKKEEGAMKTTQLEFVREQKEYINKRLRNGITGGVGIFEGIPYRIEVGQEGNPVFVFDGYFDGSSETSFLGEEEVIGNIKKRGGDDWLNDVADSFSFAYLYSIGEITNADFKKVPYVINYVPDNTQLILLGMALYMGTKEIVENAKELSQLIGQTINAATPTVGVSVGLGAGVVTTWDLGDWIMYGIYVIAKIVYIIAMTIAIVKLIEQVLEQIFPKQRDHLGMSIYDLFDKGCKHLGLTLKSDLLTAIKDEVYIPQKDRKGGEKGEKGYPTNTDPIYTFGDLIRVYMQKCNAQYKIIDGEFRFERADYWQRSSGFVLPDIFNDQERLLNRFNPNTSELVANYNIHWSTDTQDQNTLEDTTGFTFQAIIKPVIVENKDMVNMKGLTEISIPFALGKRKDNLNDLEKYAKSVFKVIDNLTGIFGKGTNFANKVEGRIGCLLLSSHFIAVGKIVKMKGSKLAPGQRDKLSARSHWDLYHFINSFAEINGIHNQWQRYPAMRIPIKEEELRIILNNEFVNSPEGKKAMIEKLTYNPYKGTIEVEYRINEIYTNNLKIEYVE